MCRQTISQLRKHPYLPKLSCAFSWRTWARRKITPHRHVRFAVKGWSLRILSRRSRHWPNCTSFDVPLAATCALLSKRRIRVAKPLGSARVSLTEAHCSLGSPSGILRARLIAKQIDETLIIGFSSKAIDDKLLTVAVHNACTRFSILVPHAPHESAFAIFRFHRR